jgi:hypothetical protein
MVQLLLLKRFEWGHKNLKKLLGGCIVYQSAMGEHSIQCCQKNQSHKLYARMLPNMPPYTTTDHVLWFFSFPFRELDPRQGERIHAWEYNKLKSGDGSGPILVSSSSIVLLDSLQFLDRLNSLTLRLPLKFRLELSGSWFQNQTLGPNSQFPIIFIYFPSMEPSALSWALILWNF